MRLAIVTTHPIQYHSPVFRELAHREAIQLRVFYGWQGTADAVDPGFGRKVEWDIPLLAGYDHEFVENIAVDPGSHHFSGIDSPCLPGRIRDWNADAILIYGWCYKSHLSVMRRFKGKIPVYFRGDSTSLAPQSRIRSRIRRLFLKWVYSHIDTAFSVGTHNRSYFLGHGLSASQVIHAPHAIDNDRFADESTVSMAQAMRKSLGIDSEAIVLLLPGKLESVKQPERLLDAHRSLDDNNVHLVFAGSGALEATLRARAGLRVHFLGFQNQSQMPAVYRAADLVCLVSKSETWGLSINEAMACGRAVLANHRVGAAIDLIKPSVNGWIVSPDTSEALVQSLREAIKTGKDGLKEYGERSKLIIRNWSIASQVDAIVSAVAGKQGSVNRQSPRAA
jgi:glycosyltransferase involved in cell wall biosynthesis